VRELWAKSQLPFDCRLLKQVAADAPLMAPELGYDSVESFLKQELQLDPDLVNRVVGWLEQEQPTGAVSLEKWWKRLLVSMAATDDQQKARGSRFNRTLKRGSNSAAYLQARLRRDAPEVADALERGEIKSARAAAIEAGIITPFPSLQLKDPAPTAQKLLDKKGQAWCLQLARRAFRAGALRSGQPCKGEFLSPCEVRLML
jgi:hypothetical protein